MGLLAAWAPAWPQTPEPSLKAAFTLNFAKFAHWPDPASDSILRVCTLGSSPVVSALQASEGAQVAGHQVELDQVKLPGDVSGCHLLYLSELDPQRDRRLLVSLSGLPIITISDRPGFARAGGMIELVLVERRLRFDINLGVVRRSGLRLEPKLLKLALNLYNDCPEED